MDGGVVRDPSLEVAQPGLAPEHVLQPAPGFLKPAHPLGRGRQQRADDRGGCREHEDAGGHQELGRRREDEGPRHHQRRHDEAVERDHDVGLGGCQRQQLHLGPEGIAEHCLHALGGAHRGRGRGDAGFPGPLLLQGLKLGGFPGCLLCLLGFTVGQGDRFGCLCCLCHGAIGAARVELARDRRPVVRFRLRRKGVDAARRVGGQGVGTGSAAASWLKIRFFLTPACVRVGRRQETLGAPAVAFRGGLLVAEAHGFGHPCPKGEPVALLLRHVCRPGQNECRTPRTRTASGLSDRLAQSARKHPQR